MSEHAGGEVAVSMNPDAPLKDAVTFEHSATPPNTQQPATPGQQAAISTEQAQRMTLPELRSAITAREAPAAAPPPFDFRVSQNGGMELTFTESGNRFVGNSAQELIEKVAQAKAEGDRYIRQLKQQIGGQSPASTQEVEPVLDATEPAPTTDTAQFTPEQEAEYTQQFIRGVMSDPEVSKSLRDQVASELLGVPAEQVPALLMDIRYTTNAARAERALMDFRIACPDYEETPENNKAVLSLLPPDRFCTAEDLRRAWAIAKYEGKAQLAMEPAPPITIPTPPPMLSSGGVSSSGDPDPWSMPLTQLKKQVQGA